MEKEKSSTQKFDTKEYEALGKRIADRLNKGKADTLTKYVNLDYIIEKIAVQIHNPEFTELLNKPANRESLRLKLDFSDEIVRTIRRRYGHYEFLRVHPRHGIPHLLFRINSDEGFNYHDYEVRVVDNKLRLTDRYDFMLGDYFSKQTSFNVVSLFSKQKQLANLDPELISQIETIKQMDAAIENNKYADAMDLYEELPKKIQRLKNFMNYKLVITAAVNDSLYQQTISEYEKMFPKDPSLYLIGLDKYTLQGDMENLLRCINKLDETVGGDTYLNLYKGIVYAVTDDSEKGMAMIDNYIKANTKDPNGYWMRLQIYLLKGDQKKAVAVLNQLNQYTMLSRREITYKVETDYSSFAETLAFQDWKEYWIAKYKERNRWKQQD